MFTHFDQKAELNLSFLCRAVGIKTHIMIFFFAPHAQDCTCLFLLKMSSRSGISTSPSLPRCDISWGKWDGQKWDVLTPQRNLGKRGRRQCPALLLTSWGSVLCIVSKASRSPCSPTQWPSPRGASGSQGRMTTSTSHWWAPSSAARERCWTSRCTMTSREGR